MGLKKIAFYINSLDKGGAQRVIVNVAEAFYQEGIQVVLVTTFQAEEEYQVSDGIRRVYSEITGDEVTGSRIRNFKNRFTKLRNIWKQEAPDVIVSFIGKNNFMAIATVQGLPTKVAVSVRGEPTEEYYNKVMRFIAKHLFNRADGVIFQTADARAFFPEKVQRKSVILPNPLDVACIRPRYQGEKENVIVAVGRVDENKNHKMLIDAFAAVQGKHPEMKLVIYGNGDQRDPLLQYGRELGLQDRIQMPGNVSDIPEKIERARIFVLTSDTEGMPNALLEAMSLGLAVISTDCPCGGPRTVIQDGENGLLVPVRDTAALTRALHRILESPALERKLSDNASQLQQELSPDKVNKVWRAYLTALCKK
ncbi:MAG: glycosyltransferase [Lachnospiraceae bacterium]|nr:glycosyltransferase [Lachnospiraceae bacterium]